MVGFRVAHFVAEASCRPEMARHECGADCCTDRSNSAIRNNIESSGEMIGRTFRHLRIICRSFDGGTASEEIAIVTSIGCREGDNTGVRNLMIRLMIFVVGVDRNFFVGPISTLRR